MDNFKAVYQILSALEKAMDYPEFNLLEHVNPSQLKVSEERFARYIEMMEDVGYIKGANVKKSITGDTILDVQNIRITLKGLEYLQENSIMQRMYKAAKGFADLIP